MRLDAFLKKTHLLKRRELARELCDAGMVRVNGAPRKASSEVAAGDELQFPVYNRMLRVRVLGMPEGNVPKAEQWSYVELLEERKLLVDDGWEEPPFGVAKKPLDH